MISGNFFPQISRKVRLSTMDGTQWNYRFVFYPRLSQVDDVREVLRILLIFILHLRNVCVTTRNNLINFDRQQVEYFCIQFFEMILRLISFFRERVFFLPVIEKIKFLDIERGRSKYL